MKRLFSVVTLAILAAIIVLAVIPTLAGGPVDFAGYCSAHGYGAPYNNGPDWYCSGSSFILNMNDVCVWQYGSGARAVNSGGWSCDGGSSTSTTTGSTGSGGTQNSGGSAVNIAGYCSAHGYGAPYSSGRDWYCGGSSFIVSMDTVCQWQNGSNATSSNVMDPNSWRCIGSGNAPSPQNNPQPTSVPQTTTNTGGSTTTETTNSGNSAGTYIGSTTPPTSGDYVQVLETDLRVRAFPNTSSDILGYVVQWHYYPLYEMRDGFALITGSLGSGWVSLEFVQVYEMPNSDASENEQSSGYMYRYSVCEVNRESAWWYDDPSSILTFIPNASVRVLEILYDIADGISTAVSLSRTMPDKVVVVFWEDMRDGSLFLDVYWYYPDYMELRHRYEMDSLEDNPCDVIYALSEIDPQG